MVGDVITNRNINSPVLGPPTSVMSLYSCTIKFEPLQAKTNCLTSLSNSLVTFAQSNCLQETLLLAVCLPGS